MTDVAYSLTEEQQLLAKTARRFIEERLPLERVRELVGARVPSAGERAADSEPGAAATGVVGVDGATWNAMAELGWLALAIPEELGGAGYGMPEVAVVLEELGRGLVPSPFLGTAVLGATAILLAGDDDQRAEHLPAVAAGERTLAVGLWDHPHRTDVAAIDATARRDGDGWLLEGRKRGVLDGVGVDAYVVAARVADGDGGGDGAGNGAQDGAGHGAGHGAVGIFVLEADRHGVTAETVPTVDLTRGLVDLVLDGVRVDANARLSDAPDAGDVLEALLRTGAVALAAEALGAAQRCFDLAVAHARTRFQFGRPIGSFQAIKHLLADDLVALEHARSTVLHAARTLDDPAEARIAASLAKAVTGAASVKVAADALQVHGGIGFTWEHDVHLFLKRVKASSLQLGTVHHHRALLADALAL